MPKGNCSPESWTSSEQAPPEWNITRRDKPQSQMRFPQKEAQR